MGGLFGKPALLKINVVNEVINEAIFNVSNTVTSSTSISQSMLAEDGAQISGNTQYADVKSNTNSVVEATQDSNFETVVKNDVAQSLERQTIAVLGAFNDLFKNTNVDLDTTIKDKVRNLNLTEVAPICASDNDITQSIVAKRGAAITDNSQVVKADFIQSCNTKVGSNMGTISDIANTINQSAKTVEENPLDFLADIIKGLVGNIASVVMLIVIIVVAGLVVLIGPGKVDANAAISQGIAAAAARQPKISVIKSPAVANNSAVASKSNINSAVVNTPLKTSVLIK